MTNQNHDDLEPLRKSHFDNYNLIYILIILSDAYLICV